jgi:hypothetical protein
MFELLIAIVLVALAFKLAGLLFIGIIALIAACTNRD